MSTAPRRSTAGSMATGRRPSSADVTSLNSRASSIISTGTKTSIGTFAQLPPPIIPPPPREPAASDSIDVLLGQRNFRITARPGSFLSIRSFDVPAPPYSEPLATPSVSPTTLVEPATPPTKAADDEPPTSTPRPPPLRIVPPHQPSALASTPSSPNPSPPYSPITCSANALSAHYTHVVRTIDTNHRAEVFQLRAEIAQLKETILSLERSHAQALAATRHSIDAAYRVEFRKVRDVCVAEIAALQSKWDTEQETMSNEVDRLGREVQFKEDEFQAAKNYALERERVARNQVEDLWEERWRTRMKLAEEEMQRAQRDWTWWEEEVERRWPGKGEETRMAVKERTRRETEEGRAVGGDKARLN